jgi:hypothetical protein
LGRPGRHNCESSTQGNTQVGVMHLSIARQASGACASLILSQRWPPFRRCETSVLPTERGFSKFLSLAGSSSPPRTGIQGPMHTRTNGARPLVGVIAALSMIVTGCASGSGSVSSQVTSGNPIPSASAATVSGVLGAQQRAYRIASGRHRLTARSGEMAERFDPAGLTLDAGTLRLGVALLGWGRAQGLRRAGGAAPIATRNRVTYRYRGGEQWFVNGPLGVEQGFTIARPPAGHGRLTIVLRIGGDVTASAESRSGLMLVSPRGVRMSYSGLTARDAAGRSLPATLTAKRHRIIISVADLGAQYPIVVDPFIELAKLVDPSGEAQSYLGDSVAMAGNTIVAADAAGGAPGRISAYGRLSW